MQRAAENRPFSPTKHPRGVLHVVHAVHQVCTRPYPSCVVVPSTGNNEPCYAFI